MTSPQTLLRRTWIVRTRFSAENEKSCGPDDWGTLPSVQISVEGRATGGPSDFSMTINNKRVFLLEPGHPQFREWMSDLISALTEAMNDPCDVLSLTQEHFAEEEQKIRRCVEERPISERFWGGLVEMSGLFDDEEQRMVAHQQDRNCYERWKKRAAAELGNALDSIPAGAHPIWQPRKLEWVFRIPGADVDLRPWRGRSPSK